MGCSSPSRSCSSSCAVNVEASSQASSLPTSFRTLVIVDASILRIADLPNTVCLAGSTPVATHACSLLNSLVARTCGWQPSSYRSNHLVPCVWDQCPRSLQLQNITKAPPSRPSSTGLPVALILGPAQGLTPSTREGSATRACGLFGFACAVIAALGRTHRAPVARGWSPPPRQEPERCRKPFRSLTPVAGTSPPP